MKEIEEIAAWVRGVLDEDERIARAAGGAWRVAAPGHGSAVETDDGATVVPDGGPPSEEQAEHLARHDPRSVLARVAAERHMLSDLEVEANPLPVDNDASASLRGLTEAQRISAEIQLRSLAWGRRFDAPGYRGDWAPSRAGG